VCEYVCVKQGLFATKAFKNGEFITSLWGAYKLKVPEASSMQVIRILQNIPKQVNLFLKIDKRCVAFYINSPGLHEQTQEITTNCDLMETASDLADSKKIGVFATRDIAPGDELWTVYGDISVGQLKGRVLHQVTLMSKANAENKKKEKSSESELKKGAEGQEALSMTSEALAMAKRKDVELMAKRAVALHDKTIRICVPTEDEDKDALANLIKPPPARRRSTRKRALPESQRVKDAKASKKAKGEESSSGGIVEWRGIVEW